MKNILVWVLLALAVLGVAWFLSAKKDMQEVDQAEVYTPAAEPLELPEKPEIKHPIEPPVQAETVSAGTEAEAEPEVEPEPVVLPALEDSDTEVLGSLGDLAQPEDLQQFLVSEQIINRIVATIDSLPSARVAPLMLPVKPVAGKFLTLGEPKAAAISPENAARYDGLVGVAVGVDSGLVVDRYKHYYPLFQQSYESLGYPDAYFNDRLVEVIDHLLLTPEPQELQEVTQNEAVFEYTDPELEALSAGQKAMLRLGADNARQVKAKLVEIRALLVASD